MLQQETPDDFVIATGETNTLQDFVAEAFHVLGRDWRKHVVCDQSLPRPSEIQVSLGNSNKAAETLGWRATSSLRDVVSRMIEAEMKPVAA